MVEKKDTKSVHRIIPCPDYDVTGVESWLSYMAEQGYIDCGMVECSVE